MKKIYNKDGTVDFTIDKEKLNKILEKNININFKSNFNDNIIFCTSKDKKIDNMCKCYGILKRDLDYFTNYLDNHNIYYFDSSFNFFGSGEDSDIVVLEIEFNNNSEMLEFENMAESKYN